MLTGDAQGRPAGDKRFHTRHRREQCADLRRRRQKLLHIVEHQQHLLLAQRFREQLQRRSPTSFSKPEGVSDRRDDPCRLGDGCQLNKGDPVLKGLLELMSNRLRKPGLADAARAGEREQTHVRAAEQIAHRGLLLFAADEWCERHLETSEPELWRRSRSRRPRRCFRFGQESGGRGTREAYKGAAILRREVKASSQQAGYFPGRTQDIPLEFADRRHRASNLPRQVVLRQVESFAALLEPGAKGGDFVERGHFCCQFLCHFCCHLLYRFALPFASPAWCNADML